MKNILDNNNNKKEEIALKNKNIKFPFNGVATNLIDKFLVLGYDQKIIEFTFQHCENIEPSNELKGRFRFFEFEERPYIVNEICYDYTKDLLDNDLILELIFPNIPEMYFFEKKYFNTKKEPDEELLISNYSIIFSINPQDNYGSKKSYNGLGFIFYSSQEHKTNDKVDGILYIPVTYVILSEFPYFYHFNEIRKCIYSQMKKESDEIPIDILLYNTVKFLQSPIKKSINLTFLAPLDFPYESKNDLNKILKPLISKDREKNRIPSMFFNQLSGYPFMDLNISFIFNLIPPDIIVEVFIFSFLEHDIIFYSSRPEILNMVMYIFSNLNYPFNDSIYYWHILSVSKDNFMSGTSTFVGKTCSTLTGLLNEYNPDILTTKKIREHFVLDIDNKNFFFLYQDETDDVQNTMTLYSYIKSCASDIDETSNDGVKMDRETKIKNYFNDGIQLYEVIKNLMQELQRRAKKVTSVNYNEKLIKPSFLTFYEDESEKECIQANMRLQKAFFTFIAQIIQNFVSILSIGDDDDPNQNNDFSSKKLPAIVINIKNEEIDEEEKQKRKLASKAGKIFKEKFRDCSKYSSFVVNFCKFHDTIDLYKIPYTFINEFIYYSHVAVGNNLSEVDVFRLIDQFYGKKKLISLEEIIDQSDKKGTKGKNNKKINKNEIKNDDDFEDIDVENIYSFNFNNFVEYYKKYLRAFINREQEDDKEIFVKVKSNSKNFKKYKRNGFYLSNKLLNTYINYINNNQEIMRKLFRLMKCEIINENNIKNNRINSFSVKFDFESFDEENLCKSDPLAKSNCENIKINQLIHKKENKIIYDNSDEEILYNTSMNKAERDIKIFGTYEFVEITDVIEMHFILERCFTSYELIKFSLLNVIAITRGMDGQVIKNPEVINTVCDFCEKTKSLVRKYMNIFLSIFQSLKIKDIIQDKNQCDDCLSIIASYFKKTNMIPTEETTKTFNEIRESTSSSESGSNEISNIEIQNKEEIKKFIEEKGKFFTIHKESLLGGKNTLKKFDEVMKTIEAIFTGSYTASKVSINAISFDYKDLEKLYSNAGLKEKDSKTKDKFIPKTPLNLYSSSNKLLSEYIDNGFTNNKNIYNEILLNILSLLYYFKIPVIGEKWIERHKIKKEKNTIIKSPRKEKSNKKVKEPSKNEGNTFIEQLSDVIKEIIAILVDLFETVKNNRKNKN